MNAGTLALAVAIGAFLVFAGFLAFALLPFVQHVSAAIPR